MKTKTIYIYYSIIFFALLTSCQTGDIENKLLLQADSLLEVRPDSALVFLNKIPVSELPTEKERAEYALLLTQAKDDNHIVQTHDSLIKSAVQYFQKNRNKKRKRQAYYYLGIVHRDMEQTTSAIISFQEALKITDKEDRLTALIYNNLSSLYQEQSFYDKAIQAAHKAYIISQKLDNKHDMAYFLRTLGLASRFANQPDSALHYYKDALKWIQTTLDRKLESFILSDIAHVYEQKGELDSAYHYINKSMQIAPEKEILASIFFVTGKVFHRLGQIDSARNYLSLSLDDANIHTRAASRLELSALEEKSGNIGKAFKYSQEYLSLKDSIDSNMKRRETAILINEHEIRTEAQRIAVFTMKQTAMIIAGIGILLILAIHFIRKYRKERLFIKYSSSADPVQALPTVLDTKDKKLQSSLAALHNSPSYAILEKVRKNEKRDIHLPAEEREELKETVLNSFSDIIAQLKRHYPKLTPDEVYCCVLYIIGCNSNQIRIIMCIESGALRVKRARIRKKIDPAIYDLIFSDKQL
ncbi:MAG: tetratricopeptide repeat protein [Bacteroides sp.]|nr:tetratricopeptide repeat protein [Bacteroides sp.]